MASALGARGLPIAFQFHSTLIILIKGGVNTISLLLKEVLRPQGLWQHVVCAHKFCLRGALGVELLLLGC